MPDKSVTTGKLGGGKNPNNNRTTGTIVPSTENTAAGSVRLASGNTNPPYQAQCTLARQHLADHIVAVFLGHKRIYRKLPD